MNCPIGKPNYDDYTFTLDVDCPIGESPFFPEIVVLKFIYILLIKLIMHAHLSLTKEGLEILT